MFHVNLNCLDNNLEKHDSVIYFLLPLENQLNSTLWKVGFTYQVCENPLSWIQVAPF